MFIHSLLSYYVCRRNECTAAPSIETSSSLAPPIADVPLPTSQTFIKLDSVPSTPSETTNSYNVTRKLADEDTKQDKDSISHEPEKSLDQQLESIELETSTSSGVDNNSILEEKDAFAAGQARSFESDTPTEASNEKDATDYAISKAEKEEAPIENASQPWQSGEEEPKVQFGVTLNSINGQKAIAMSAALIGGGVLVVAVMRIVNRLKSLTTKSQSGDDLPELEKDKFKQEPRVDSSSDQEQIPVLLNKLRGRISARLTPVDGHEDNHGVTSFDTIPDSVTRNTQRQRVESLRSRSVVDPETLLPKNTRALRIPAEGGQSQRPKGMASPRQDGVLWTRRKRTSNVAQVQELEEQPALGTPGRQNHSMRGGRQVRASASMG